MRDLPVELDLILVAYLFLCQITHRDLSNGTLANPRIGNDVPLLVRFKLLDCVYFTILHQDAILRRHGLRRWWW